MLDAGRDRSNVDHISSRSPAMEPGIDRDCWFGAYSLSFRPNRYPRYLSRQGFDRLSLVQPHGAACAEADEGVEYLVPSCCQLLSRTRVSA